MHKFKRNLLRFFILIITVVLLSYGSLITAYSANKVDFVLSDYNCDNNRLFTISMTADSDKKLCAASFEFTYDKSMFEFRSAKVSDKTSKIAYNELSDKVKLVLLNADGINIINGESIFTLTFKAVKSGTGYIDFLSVIVLTPILTQLTQENALQQRLPSIQNPKKAVRIKATALINQKKANHQALKVSEKRQKKLLLFLPMTRLVSSILLIIQI